MTKSNLSEDAALDEGEAAALLGCSRSYLAALRRRGMAPRHFKVGAAPRYVVKDIIAWRDARIAGATSAEKV